MFEIHCTEPGCNWYSNYTGGSHIGAAKLEAHERLMHPIDDWQKLNDVQCLAFMGLRVDIRKAIKAAIDKGLSIDDIRDYVPEQVEYVVQTYR